MDTLIGALPTALHDAAGAGLDGSLYVFGGGDGVGQLDSIVRVDASGATASVGTLPAASSDSEAAVIGSTAYVVGGYTGTQWLDTIIAFTPGAGRGWLRVSRIRSATPRWARPAGGS